MLAGAPNNKNGLGQMLRNDTIKVIGECSAFLLQASLIHIGLPYDKECMKSDMNGPSPNFNCPTYTN